MDLPYDIIEIAFNCYEIQCGVAANLCLEDIKSLRLVNKVWRQAGIQFLREKSLVTLDSPTSFQNYLAYLEDQGEEEAAFCFANYRVILKPSKFNSLQQATELFSQFWDTCHVAVKELTLQFPWTCCHHILTQIYSSNPDTGNAGRNVRIERLSIALDDTPVEVEASDGGQPKWTQEHVSGVGGQDNFVICGTSNNSLISLHLNVSIVLSTEKKVFPFNWVQFLQSCSNICHLSIQSDYASVHFVKLVNALVDRQVVLKTLKIGTRDQRLFSDEFLKQLVYLTGRETKTVSLGFLPSVKHNTPLDFVLRQSASALTSLTFLQLRTSNQGAIVSFTASDTTCSAFPKLTCLRITKDLVPNLAFLVKMPMLRRLEIYRDSTIGQHDDLSNPVIRTRSLSVVMEHLQSLVLEPFVPLEHVWKLTNWFPNLQRLQMKVNDMIARVVFSGWSELRELYLIGEIHRDLNDIVRSSLTDEGITGLSKEDLQQSDGAAGGNWNRTVAYIGDLRKLEVCKMQVVPDYQTGLTDYSIQYGVADVATLRSVCLVKTLVSPAGADMLRMRGVQVTLSND